MTTHTQNDLDDFTTENPSICIPRVFADIRGDFISNIFQNQLKLGKIKKIDIIKNHNDKKFKKVFIHFDVWYDTEMSNNTKQKLINGDIIKIVYDFPWFWRCAICR